MAGEILGRDGARRRQGCLALGSHLILNLGKTAIDLELGLLSQGCSGGEGGTYEEGAAGRLSPRPPCSRRVKRLFEPSEGGS